MAGVTEVAGVREMAGVAPVSGAAANLFPRGQAYGIGMMLIVDTGTGSGSTAPTDSSTPIAATADVGSLAHPEPASSVRASDRSSSIGRVLSPGSVPGSFIWQPTFGVAHPAGHGPITFELATDTGKPEPGAVITSARIRAHAAHRGAEKLFETRDYRQLMMLGDRHDWNSSFGSELGLALTIEQALGITAPIRANWLRTLMAELNRVIHHLRWLGESAAELSESTADQLHAAELSESTAVQHHVAELREQLTYLHESYSGGRLHPMLVQPGGMRLDVPAGWLDQLSLAIDQLPTIAAELREFFTQYLGQDAPPLVGRLTRAQAISFGVSGPVARAAGLELDLRLDEPYCSYAELAECGALQRSTAVAGDSLARFLLLIDELNTSENCLRAGIDELRSIESASPISVKLPRSIRLPHGTYYGWTENPTGINGWFITSTGGATPYRVKLRTASFNNAQALESVLVGATLAQLKLILMSWQLTSGDLSK